MSDKFGIYVFDTDCSHGIQSKHLLANTVEENKTKFTDRDISKANTSRRLEAILSFPSTKQFRHALENNVILNCPVESNHVITAKKIYGVHPATLAGKTTKKGSREIPITPALLIILDSKYKHFCISVDVLTINRVKFLTTIVPTIKHSTVTPIDKATANNLWSALKPTLNKYKKRGFILDEIRADGELGCICGIAEAFGVGKVNICASNKHEPCIERHHRVLEERMRALLAHLPFSRGPKASLQALTNYTTCLNNLFDLAGVPKTLSPTYIMECIWLEY